MSVTFFLVLATAVTLLLSALGKAPLWVAVFFLWMIEALRIIPVR